MGTRRQTQLAERRRYAQLKKMLEDRRGELMHEVQGRIRDARADRTVDRDVLDEGDSSDANVHDDLEFSLIQMKSEILNNVHGALRRLDEGTYGYCFECGEAIAEPRLRALPFALRCKECEEARETAERRERPLVARGSALPLLFET